MKYVNEMIIAIDCAIVAHPPIRAAGCAKSWDTEGVNGNLVKDRCYNVLNFSSSSTIVDPPPLLHLNSRDFCVHSEKRIVDMVSWLKRRSNGERVAHGPCTLGFASLTGPSRLMARDERDVVTRVTKC
jgi:hypothetical protein